METEAITYFYEEMGAVESAMEPLRTLASPVRRTLCSLLQDRGLRGVQAYLRSQVFL